jgi:outer membrane protein OmpA-like peptidoglycan-associated protein
MRGAFAVFLTVLLGCASTYDQAYQDETQRLEEAARQEQARETARHGEASSKYAAVVYFDLGSAALSEDGMRELRWFRDQMQPYPEAHFEVQGFADITGSESTNRELSQERAANVARYLASEGMTPSHIHVIGLSTDFPAESNESAKGRSRNRRVEVTVR